MSEDKTFRFVWKKPHGGNAWYRRTVVASNLEKATQSLLKHLRARHQEEFVVDHYVQEFATDGTQLAMHSLATEPKDFQVYFNNKAWPSGSRISRD